MKLSERLNDFVTELFDKHQSNNYRSSKVIHDSLWGTSRYYPYELVVIDSPIFQRLRYINQTGLAFVAYPSLNHSRFEHSLGVATVVKRFIRKLEEKSGSQICEDYPKEVMFAELRLAALLHDIGHGFFSHLSEEIYKDNKELQEIGREPRFDLTQPSEILAYLLLDTPNFRHFFENEVVPKAPKGVNLDTILGYITGKAPPDRHFCAQIINGAVDADKIDYISRDTFYSGISTTIDVDRLFNDISLKSLSNGRKTLVMTSSTALERLLFSKVLLYSTIYHHQKVKAADCMIQGLIEYIKESDSASLFGFRFDDPLDYLRVSDNDIFSNNALKNDDEFVRKTVSDLLNRKILRRCLVLSRVTIDNYEGSAYQLNRLSQSPGLLRQLRQRIVDELPAGSKCSVHDVWISLPQQPSLREASQTLVVSPIGEIQTLNQFFPLDGWLRAFSDNKWRGYVFAPIEIQTNVNSAAKKVFSEVLGIQLNAKSSAYAHVEESTQ